MAHLTLEHARAKLAEANEARVRLLAQGPLEIHYYQPADSDRQRPHQRDGAYAIVRGTGEFINGQQRHPFGPGDLLFVPAGREHKFVDFSDDLATWVFLYGPTDGEEGEQKASSPDEQMAAFEDALKEEDWGHQPC